MPVIFEYIIRQVGVAFMAGLVAAAVGPLSGQCLDKPFGLAVGLGSVGSCEAVLDAALITSGGKGVRGVARAVVGHHAGHLDSVEGVEAECLFQGTHGAGDLFIGVDAGKTQPAVVVDGDMQRLHAGSDAAIGAVAGAAHSGPLETTQLLDVQVDQLPGMLTLITDRRRGLRFKELEPVELMPTQHPADGRLGYRHQHQDQCVGLSFTPERHDPCLDGFGGFSGLVDRHAGAVVEPFAEPLLIGSPGPLPSGLFTDPAGSVVPSASL